MVRLTRDRGAHVGKRARSWYFLVASICLSAAAIAGNEAAADQTASVIGCSIGSLHPYCTDPVLLALRAAQDIAWPAAEEVLGIGTLVDQDNAYRSEVLSCRGDLACLAPVVASRTGKLRGWAFEDEARAPALISGGSETMLSAEVVILVAAAETAARTERLALLAGTAANVETAKQNIDAASVLRFEAEAAQIDANAAAYADAWRAATEPLVPYPDAFEKFVQIYKAPDDWVAWRDDQCGGDPACRVRYVPDTMRMTQNAARALRQAQQRAEAVAALERQRAANAAVAESWRKEQEALRLEAEKRRRELVQGITDALSPGRIGAIFPKDSLLRHLVLNEFDQLDVALTEQLEKEYEGIIEDSIRLFATDYQAESIKTRLIANRRNILAANYIVTRMREIGACGDAVKNAHVRSVSGTQTKTLSGRIVSETEGFEVYHKVPSQFSRYIERTGINDSDLFEREVGALGCQNPVRLVLETNLIEFAEGRSFIPWR